MLLLNFKKKKKKKKILFIVKPFLNVPVIPVKVHKQNGFQDREIRGV